MSEPVWVPLGAGASGIPQTRKAPLVISSGMLGEMYWPDASLTNGFFYFYVPTDYAGGDLIFRIQLRCGATGTVRWLWTTNRFRDGSPYSLIDNAVVLDTPYADTNSHMLSRTVAAAGFQPGDLIRVGLARSGADGVDTMAGNAIYDGGWVEYLGIGSAVTGAVAAGAPPLLTTLPGSPVDGQEVILCDSLTAPTYTWHLRYVAGIADAYKWVFLGGTPKLIRYDAEETTTSTTPVDLGGPAFTVPCSGIYECLFGAGALRSPSGAGPNAYVGLFSHGGQVLGVSQNAIASGGQVWNTGGHSVAATLGAGQILRLRYWVSSADGAFGYRFLRVVPARLA